MASITSLAKYGRTWRNGFSGNLSAGYTYTKSSEIGRLNFDGSVKYSSAKSETKLQASTIVTSDSVEVKRERDDVILSYSYSLDIYGRRAAHFVINVTWNLAWIDVIRKGWPLDVNYLSARISSALLSTGMAIQPRAKS